MDKLAKKAEASEVDPEYVDNLRAFADCLRAGFVLPVEWQDRSLGHRLMEARS